MGTIVDVTDAEWDQVADLFDPDGRRGAPDRRHPGPALPLPGGSGTAPRRYVGPPPARRRAAGLIASAGLVGDRGYRGLAKLADRHGVALDIKRPPTCVATVVPLRPLVKVEHAFAELGRWRRLSRCYEQTVASAKAWLEVAAMGYLFARLRVEPP